MTELDTGDQAAPAESPSLEARIASKFGLPSAPPETQQAEEGTEETEATGEPELADVEWGGKSFRVPKDLLEPISKATDYTKKTQDLAEQRRSVEHIQQIAQQSQLDRVFQESIAPEQNELSIIDAFLTQASRVDINQMSMEQMFKHKMEIDAIKERREQLKASVNEKRSKFDADVKVKIEELRKNAWDMTTKKIGASLEDAQKTVHEFGLKSGLTEAELANVLLDPRSAEILWKAAQFDKIKAGTTQAAEKATKANPTLKPGAASERMPSNVAAKLNFNKAMKQATTSRDKEKVIEQRLAGMFGGK